MMTTLADVKNSVDTKGFYIDYFESISEFESLDIDYNLDLFLSTLREHELSCLPRVVQSKNGISVANIEKTLHGEKIVFYKETIDLDKTQNTIKYALLIGKMAAVMARVDGQIDEEEITRLKDDIYSLGFLTNSEKYLVFVRSVYWLNKKISKDLLLSSYDRLPLKTKLNAIKICQDIAIADGRIDRAEVFLLRDLYKLADKPTATVSKDLKTRAKELGIDLGSKNKTIIAPTIEVDNSLEDLLSEFESF